MPKKSLFAKQFADSYQYYLLAATLSILFSCWRILSGNVINPDGICYLAGADAMQHGITATMHACHQARWPFYSASIFIVSRLTGLSYFVAAHVLDTFFSLITVLTFISIVRFFNASAQLSRLAIVVIFLAPEFNSLLGEILHGHGFWTFYLLSILCLLHFYRHPTWQFAFSWNACLLAATLYRIEGAVFLLLMPWIVWLDTSSPLLKRLRHFIKLNLPTLCIGFALTLWLLLHPQQELTRFGELLHQFTSAWNMVMQRFTDESQGLATHVLTLDAANDANRILFLVYVSLYAIQVVTTLSVIYTGLVIYAWCKQLRPANFPYSLVLWGYILLNLVITFTFLIEHFVLSKRYLIALSLTLMIWVPFALDRLIQVYQQKKWVLYTLFIAMALCSISNIIHFGCPKVFIRDAGGWLAINAPTDKKIYANDFQLMYYANHFTKFFPEWEASQKIKPTDWDAFDYLALREDAHHDALKASMQKNSHFVLIKQFANHCGDQVQIYQKINRSSYEANK